jgi:hypothetical protein
MSKDPLLEITATRDSVTSLDLITGHIERAYTSRDYALTLELLSEYVLEAWFGLNPERLLRILQVIESSGQPIPAVLAALRTMMLGATSASGSKANSTVQNVDSMLLSQAPPASDSPDELSSMTAAHKFIWEYSEMYTLRLLGRPVEALQQLILAEEHRSHFQTLYTSHGGWGLFSKIQASLTAMLAGDFPLAETFLTEAKLHNPLPRLPFLTRDAHAKSALLHACSQS